MKRYLFLLTFALLGVGANEAPAQPCHDAVQGEIAWNYDGDTNWAEDNVQRLCKGAEDSREPAQCFERVMHGGVNWGGGTQWEWENALELCQGTRDADATVTCFERKIADGLTWQKAIDACQWSSILGRSIPLPPVVLPDTLDDGADTDAGGDPGESLRIGTYNFQFFRDFIRTVEDCCRHDDHRPESLAERIIASDYDIIALQEVFDVDDAKDPLLEELSDEYPHYVKTLQLRGDDLQHDSGLMLFSKWPFQQLPDDVLDSYGEGSDFDTEGEKKSRGAIIGILETFGLSPREIPGLITGVAFARDQDTDIEASNDDRVAYLPYDSCAGQDCLSDKGAGYVRIQNPTSGRIYNVFFTHLQAGNQDVQGEQLNSLQGFIQGVLDEDQLREEAIFVLGDFNVNGNWKDDHRQYDVTFGPDGIPFFTEVLHDAWNFDPPRDDTQHPDVPMEDRDVGSTTVGGTPRRDHILHNKEAAKVALRGQQLCIQHMTIAYNLRSGGPVEEGGMYEQGGDVDLSDHYGLNADVNLWAPHCSPHEAAEIEASDFNDNGNVIKDGRITHPGSVQWYLFDRGGTYSIKVHGKNLSGDDLDFRVYESDAMSEPFQGKGYKGETRDFFVDEDNVGEVREARTYGPVEPPFYIKVYAANDKDLPSRTKMGNYQLIVKRHRGVSPEDAILLYPNKWGTKAIRHGDVSGGPSSRSRWFKLDTEGPDSERAQTLRFYVEPGEERVPSEDGPYEMRLHKRKDSGRDRVAHTKGRDLDELTITRRDANDNWSRMYLEVIFPPSADQFRAGWHTNLVVLSGNRYGLARGEDFPMRLRNVKQADNEVITGGPRDDDDIEMRIAVGTKVIGGPEAPEDCRRAPFCIDLGGFNTGESKPIRRGSPFTPLRFLWHEETVRIQLDEDDADASRGHTLENTEVAGFRGQRAVYPPIIRFFRNMKSSRGTWVWEKGGESPYPYDTEGNGMEISGGVPSRIKSRELGDEPFENLGSFSGDAEYRLSFVVSHGLQGFER